MGLAVMCASMLARPFNSQQTHFCAGRILRVSVFSCRSNCGDCCSSGASDGGESLHAVDTQRLQLYFDIHGFFSPADRSAKRGTAKWCNRQQRTGRGTRNDRGRRTLRTRLDFTYRIGDRLNPAGFPISEAIATNGSQQVGYGEHSSIDGGDHALLWNGSAASAVDLNPPGFGYTYAFATDGTHQVGEGRSGGTEDALLWTGIATSVVDLSRSVRSIRQPSACAIPIKLASPARRCNRAMPRCGKGVPHRRWT